MSVRLRGVLRDVTLRVRREGDAQVPTKLPLLVAAVLESPRYRILNHAILVRGRSRLLCPRTLRHSSTEAMCGALVSLRYPCRVGFQRCRAAAAMAEPAHDGTRIDSSCEEFGG